MRTLLSAVIALTIILCGAARPAQAQERVTSYSFAPSRHVTVEHKSTEVGKIFDSVDGALDPLKGERGTTLLLGCTGLTMLALIVGMPMVALVGGVVSALLMLLNNPSLLVLLIIPIGMFRHELLALFASATNEEESKHKTGQADCSIAASLLTDKKTDDAKENKNKSGKKSKDASPLPIQKAESSQPPKLARPL